MDIPYLTTGKEALLPAWSDWEDIRNALCETDVARCTQGYMSEDHAFKATLVVLLDFENDSLTRKAPSNFDCFRPDNIWGLIVCFAER